ncbi:MAG: HDIG domain-containing metalloprotein, partial [Thermoplasmatota archaeon]
REVYDMSDYNVSVGSEPHSEVAALAVFMDRLNEKKIDRKVGGEISVLPTEQGKRVVNYSSVPPARECYEYLKEIDIEGSVIEHSIDVLERALELHDKFGGDLKLIVAGALLHDVGRSVTHGVKHGVEGGKIAREEGWHEELAKIIERHIGGGITKEEAESQGLPVRSYVPKSLEEKLICHADNTAGGKERFDDLINRTEKAGYKASADRMRELARYFEEEQYLE